jgi:hypothetical protein
MARSQTRDPFSNLVSEVAAELQSMIDDRIAARDFNDDNAVEQEITREGVDGDGYAITKTGFTIGFSSIGGPDAIYSSGE